MKLINERLKLGLSQSKAAKEMGISQSMLAMLESGERSGSDKTKMKVAKFYGVDVGTLFFDDEITNRDSKEAIK